MLVSNYINRFEANANTFTYDFYIQALRRYIKTLAYNGKIGIEEKAPINPQYLNIRTACLLLGESNRMFHRYPLIESLLIESSTTNFDKYTTKYFEKLFRVYEKSSFISRIFGRRDILQKQDRVIKINEWIKIKKTIKGVDSFLRGNTIASSPLDLPLTIKIDNLKQNDSYVQLDGSHRRCIFYYNGFDEILSNVVTIDELKTIILNEKPVYLYDHWKNFYEIYERVISL